MCTTFHATTVHTLLSIAFHAMISNPALKQLKNFALVFVLFEGIGFCMLIFSSTKSQHYENHLVNPS